MKPSTDKFVTNSKRDAFREGFPKDKMKSSHLQLNLPLLDIISKEPLKLVSDSKNNKLLPQDRCVHDWYRFVLSFPPHLVRNYIKIFKLDKKHVILDPFCGTGTTLIESKLHGIRSVGLEANPFAHFASSVKIDFEIDPCMLKVRAHDIADATLKSLRSQGIDDSLAFDGNISNPQMESLNSEAQKILLKNSISPLPLHKTLVLLNHLKKYSNEPYYKYGLLALANALVSSISNIRFGPEIGIGKPKTDVPVVSSWLTEINKITNDLRFVANRPYSSSSAYLADARKVSHFVEPCSINAVITSPPYPNEKDYSRITRLESVILGFINNNAELKEIKKTFVRSNTRGVYKDDEDDKWIAQHTEIQGIAKTIERRRIELEKTSGFERLYEKVTRLYFGGMACHLAELRTVLRPGAQLAYVVGDQASYFRVMIYTGRLLAKIAQTLGYELLRIDLFRTRFSTVTKNQLREEVVILRWPG